MNAYSRGNCPHCKTSLGDLDSLMTELKNAGLNAETQFDSACCQQPIKAFKELSTYYIADPAKTDGSRQMIGSA